MRRPSGGRVVAAVLGGSLLLLFVLPVVALVTYAPFSDLVSAADSGTVRQVFEFTLFASGMALALTVVLGVPLGYLLARGKFPGRSVVESVVTVPVVVPHIIAGLALLLLAVRLGPSVTNSVTDTVWGVVLVMAYVSAPYTVIASQLAFRSVDERLVESARSLGASPGQAFRRVTFPLAFRGVAAGAALSWARAVSEIGGLLVIAPIVDPGGAYLGPVTQPASIYIFNLFQIGDLPGAASVASLFVLAALVLFLAVRILERSGRLPWVGRGLPE